jgi:prepilin-type processing-associated H-X9-DG protein
VTKVRVASSRTQSQNNLKQIALAMHNYHDTFGSFPAAAICDKNGKPMLSWRVAILPFIEQDNLYKQFHLDEPWDSDHNKKLLAHMPKTYELPGVNKPGETDTYYRVFYNNGALFDLRKGVKITQITDGTSNTIMCAEAAEGVPWSKPDDLEYDPNKPLPKLGKQDPKVFNVAMADGSVRTLSKSISEKTLRAAITRDGGEVLGSDF